MGKTEEHEVEELIDNLKSNLFFHGHPISRREAKEDLGLKVEDATNGLENLMWALYLEYEKELKLNEPLNLLREMELKSPPAPAPAPPTTQQIVQQMQQLAANGIGLPGTTEEQLVRLAAAMVPFVGGAAPPARKVTLDPISGAFLESAARADVFKTDLRVERVSVNLQSGPQEAFKQEILWQRWEEEK
jgi:hypothetical protein